MGGGPNLTPYIIYLGVYLSISLNQPVAALGPLTSEVVTDELERRALMS